MTNNNPFRPGRPKVVQDTKDLPDEPGEYRLIDPDPGLIKQAICFAQGKDPNVDHLGIAGNLHERVNGGHEKLEDHHEVHFQVAEGEKNEELWEDMKAHERDKLQQIQPNNADANRGGAGRPPDWAKGD